MKALLFSVVFTLALSLLSPDTLAQPFRGGLKRTKGRDIGIGASVSDEAYAKLPRSVSYEAFCPTAVHQGDFEMSVAFASAYYLRTILENQARNVRERAGVDANRFSPTYLYSRIKLKDDHDCQGGAYVNAALETLRREGVPRMKSVSSQPCDPLVSATLVEEAGRYRISDYKALFGSETASLNKLRLLKKTLADGTPALIEFMAPESFTLAKNVWTRATNEVFADASLGLALCVIGYNDDLAGGAFQVVNSWGTEWGRDGKCWIRYADMTTFVTAAYRVDPVSIEARPTLVTGGVDLRLVSGIEVPMARTAEGTYQPKGDYPAEKQVKLTVSSSQPMSLYLFELSGDKVETYVPLEGQSAPVVKSGESYTFGEVITLDKALGNDYLVFIYSRQPIPDLVAFRKKLQQAAGTPQQKVASVLSGMTTEGVEYSPNRMSFNLTTAKPNVLVPVVLQL